MENRIPTSDHEPYVIDAPTGTLMWVGDRDRPEFQEAYRFCEQHAAQLALRGDLADALARPAAAVERILVLRKTRAELDSRLESELASRYPEASVVHLLGPLCAGESPSRLEPFASKRFYWHQANQVLPDWFRAGHSVETRSSGASRAVAVIAATASAAEPLLELAASAGAAAVWCRQADRFRVRNIDVLWWDDSAAPPASDDIWRRRIASAADSTTGVRGDEAGPRGADHRRQRHAWLANSPSLGQCRSAWAAGVETVLTKPAQIEPLLAMVSPAETFSLHRHPTQVPSKPAAAPEPRRRGVRAA